MQNMEGILKNTNKKNMISKISKYREVKTKID
jgi:hypothetical protein